MTPVGSVVMYLGPLAASQVSDKRSEIWPASETAAPGSPFSVPGGAIVWTGDWLVCDGRHVLIAQYPLLSMVLDGAYDTNETPNGHFTLPDLRGAFVRGVDAGAGVDPDVHDRTSAKGQPCSGVGSLQRDALQLHQHDYNEAVGATPAQSGQTAVLSLRKPSPTSGHVADGGGPVRTSRETRPLNVAAYYLIRCR